MAGWHEVASLSVGSIPDLLEDIVRQHRRESHLRALSTIFMHPTRDSVVIRETAE